VRKNIFLLVFCLFIPVLVFAQNESKRGEDIWISLGGEVVMYSITTPAYGGGLSFGYGKGISIGLTAAFFFAPATVSTIELSFLLRFYLKGMEAYSGPFLQITAGPSLFFIPGEKITFPPELGMISAGLSFGWRFLFKDRWFIEPAIRGGYPFIVGGGFSAGVRF